MKIIYGLALALALICASEAWSMETLRWHGKEGYGWVCSGEELRPKSGANSGNTWIMRGNEIRPKMGANSSNTWVIRGNEIRPKSGANSSNTWIIQGNEIRPKSGANSANTWRVGDAPLLAIVGKVILRLY